MRTHKVDICVNAHHANIYNWDKDNLVRHKVPMLRSVWYGIVQLGKQHNNVILLQPKVFNPNILICLSP